MCRLPGGLGGEQGLGGAGTGRAGERRSKGGAGPGGVGDPYLFEGAAGGRGCAGVCPIAPPGTRSRGVGGVARRGRGGTRGIALPWWLGSCRTSSSSPPPGSGGSRRGRGGRHPRFSRPGPRWPPERPERRSPAHRAVLGAAERTLPGSFLRLRRSCAPPVGRFALPRSSSGSPDPHPTLRLRDISSLPRQTLPGAVQVGPRRAPPPPTRPRLRSHASGRRTRRVSAREPTVSRPSRTPPPGFAVAGAPSRWSRGCPRGTPPAAAGAPAPGTPGATGSTENARAPEPARRAGQRAPRSPASAADPRTGPARGPPPGRRHRPPPAPRQDRRDPRRPPGAPDPAPAPA